MAQITSYATLKTEVAGWLHVGSSRDAEIPGWIQFAENRIYRDLRVRQMETAFSDTIASGVIALPTNYLELKNARISSTAPTRNLQRTNAENIYQMYPTRSADGTPRYIARDGTNFIFGPYPDSAYTVAGTYYKRLTALSTDNTSNWLITDIPEVLLFATLAEAAPWTQNDERLPLFERKYQQLLEIVRQRDVDEEFSGSPLVATVR